MSGYFPMFSIFKKKAPAAVDLSELKADMHSHLLPGIDDGAPDSTASLELIKGLQELGFQKLITTPHIMGDLYKNDESTIRTAYDALLKEQKLPLPLSFAAEHLMDEHFEDLLQHDIPLLAIKDNWVLVEFSFINAPLNVKEKIFNLQIKGYQPVLAHPERYLYFAGAQKGWYDELKAAGCYFQLNLLSLTNYYGKASLELAEYLIKKQYVNLLGTDMHHTRHLHALQFSPTLTKTVKNLLDSGQILNPSL
ncbi:MAG: histidinol phosphatase [Chitinophagaceae bacterium]